MNETFNFVWKIIFERQKHCRYKINNNIMSGYVEGITSNISWSLLCMTWLNDMKCLCHR